MIKFLSICLLAVISIGSSGQKPNENSLRMYFEKSDTLNPIEGFWSVETSGELYHYDTLLDVKNIQSSEQVGVIREGEIYKVYMMNGDEYNVQFSATDVKGVYMYQNYFKSSETYSKKQAVISTHGKMQYTYDLPEELAIKYWGDAYDPNNRVVLVLKWKKQFPVVK